MVAPLIQRLTLELAYSLNMMCEYKNVCTNNQVPLYMLSSPTGLYKQSSLFVVYASYHPYHVYRFVQSIKFLCVLS